MRLEYKLLKIKELESYLQLHHGKLVENSFSSFCNYYECENNILVVENTKENNATIYFNREKVYEEERRVRERSKFDPFKDKQFVIMNLEHNKQILLDELFAKLKIKREYPLSNISLSHLNTAIKNYGYANVIRNLYLNLIVFVGEYIRENRHGQWILKKEPSNLQEFEPIFIDEKNRNYRFEINVLIIKTFYEKGKFDIKEVINFALLPTLDVKIPSWREGPG